MNRPQLRRLLGAAWLLGIVLTMPVLAADAYDFELVIFERPNAGGGEYWPATPGQPDRARANGGSIEGMPRASRALGPVAYTLRQKGMIVHEHLAWRQVPRGRGSSTWYWLTGDRLSGLIRITRGRFLHLETDLLLYESATGRPFRVKLNRRMRSGELHYVDHPKLGIVMQAERVASRAADTTEFDNDGEPRPAEPAATARPG